MGYRSVLLGCIALLVVMAAPGLAGPPAPIYTFSLDTDPGWTATGSFRYGPACTGPGACAVGAHTGTNVYGNAVSGSGQYGSTGTLTTTALDCSGLTGVTLSFWRNLGLAMQNADYVGDYASLEVSNDGSTWTTVWQTQSGEPDSFDTGWTYRQYDISPYADNQSTVYLRWALGPIDAACGCMGFNIDDVQLSGSPVDIAIWLGYASWADPANDYEVWNPLVILAENFPHLTTVSGSWATDAATLENELQGMQVVIIPEQELADGATLEAKGAEFADVLQRFVTGGGTLIVCSDFSANGFLTGTGLMQTAFAGWYDGGQPLTVADPFHPLANWVSTPVATNSTITYEVPPDAFVVITGPDGNAVVAERQHGAGAVILLGYDYYQYDTAAAQVLANAVRFPTTRRMRALVYERPEFSHTAPHALGRLRVPYHVVDAGFFNAALGAPEAPNWWSVVTVDDPFSQPTGGWGPLAGYVANLPVPALVSTWGLSGVNTGADTLASALGAASTEGLSAVPPVYDWTGGGLFSWWESIPSPISTWANNWGYDADRLSVTGTDALAMAGFDSASPVAGNAAIVENNCCHTMVDGFLWDDASQDADGDGVMDVEELVTNQLALLLRVPSPTLEPDVWALTVGGTVTFTNCCPRPQTTWCYAWYPESTDDAPLWDKCLATGADTSYTYNNIGFFFPVLEAWNGAGARRAAPSSPIAVGFPDTTPDFWAFRHIIACYVNGVVKGYDDGNYHPWDGVLRDAMAVYIARAQAGGDDAVPAGPATASFPDVDPSYWAYKYIEYCYANGIVTGALDGNYHPWDAVLRDAMAVYVARASAGGEAFVPDGPATPTFPDVDASYWAYKYVEYCVANGIVQGKEDGLYHPWDPVTRDAMAVYVQRAFGYETYAP